MTAHGQTPRRLPVLVAAIVVAGVGNSAGANDSLPHLGHKAASAVQRACGAFGRAAGMETGTIAPEGIILRDLTGDGRDDLIIDHNAIACTHSPFIHRRTCDARGCAIRLFVDNKLMFAFHIEGHAVSFSITEGEPPSIILTDANGGQSIWRWDGTYFREINRR